jgi:hypothetical protein
MSFKTTATIASFGGKLLKLTHNASTTGCEMALNLYLPPQASSSKKVPVLFYLAGLTCTGDNGAEKGFFQHGASQKGIAIVYPDTSPRNLPSLSPFLPFFLSLRPQLKTHSRRAQNSRRRGRLRFRIRRRLLHRCYQSPLRSKLQDGILHHVRTAQGTLLLIP